MKDAHLGLKLKLHSLQLSADTGGGAGQTEQPNRESPHTFSWFYVQFLNPPPDDAGQVLSL